MKEFELRFPVWSSRTLSLCSGLEECWSKKMHLRDHFDEWLSCLQDQGMLEQVALQKSLYASTRHADVHSVLIQMMKLRPMLSQTRANASCSEICGHLVLTEASRVRAQGKCFLGGPLDDDVQAHRDAWLHAAGFLPCLSYCPSRKAQLPSKKNFSPHFLKLRVFGHWDGETVAKSKDFEYRATCTRGQSQEIVPHRPRLALS